MLLSKLLGMQTTRLDRKQKPANDIRQLVLLFGRVARPVSCFDNKRC